MSRKRTGLGSYWLLVAALCAQASFAAPDDPDVVPVQVEVIDDERATATINFDQVLFRAGGNPSSARNRIESRFELQINELARICELTEVQKQKLLLASEADVRQFFEEADQLRQKAIEAAVKDGGQALNQIWPEVQPLQTKLAVGLFDDDSFFVKALPKALNAEQLAKYRSLIEERTTFRYRGCIETALIMLAKTVPLTHEQREALIKLLVDETPPPRIFGQFDQSWVLFQLAMLPPDRVKPLVDDRQWKRMEHLLMPYRPLKDTFMQQGLMRKE